MNRRMSVPADLEDFALGPRTFRGNGLESSTARDENIFSSNAVALPLCQSVHDVSRLTEGCNRSVPKHARNHTQVRKGERCGEAYVHQ